MHRTDIPTAWHCAHAVPDPDPAANAHARPWQPQAGDAALDRLANGAPLATSTAQRHALQRLPQRIAELTRRSVVSEPLAQDLPHLLAMFPADLLREPCCDYVATFSGLIARHGETPLNDKQRQQLTRLMNDVQRLGDRVVPGGPRYEADVLQGLAELHRWERSPHAAVSASTRSTLARQLQRAALSEPYRGSGRLTVVVGNSAALKRVLAGDIAPDLPDAGILSRLHLPKEIIEIRGDGSEVDWSEVEKQTRFDFAYCARPESSAGSW